MALRSFAMAGALAVTAAPQPVQIQSLAVRGARLVTPTHLVATGSVACTKGAHFQVYGYAVQPGRGALAKGKLPPKTTPGTPDYARFKAATACTGAARAWSLDLLAATASPVVPLGAGPVRVCVTVTISKSHLYDDVKVACASATLA